MRHQPLGLADITLLAQAQIAKEAEVKAKEAALSAAKMELLRIREDSLPMAMIELEQERVKLSSGEEVTLKREVYCSITEENKPDAFAWLKENDFDGIIKNVVTVEFGKGEEMFAEALLEHLRTWKCKASISVPQPPKKVKTKVKQGKKTVEKIKMVKQPPKLTSITKQLEPQPSRAVHPQTLKAFLGEQLRKSDGPEVPLELFGARPVWVSKIKQPNVTK